MFDASSYYENLKSLNRSRQTYKSLNDYLINISADLSQLGTCLEFYQNLHPPVSPVLIQFLLPSHDVNQER